MTIDAATSLRLHRSTLAALRELKDDGQTWDEFLLTLADEEMDRIERHVAESDLMQYRKGQAGR